MTLEIPETIDKNLCHFINKLFLRLIESTFILSIPLILVVCGKNSTPELQTIDQPQDSPKMPHSLLLFDPADLNPVRALKGHHPHLTSFNALSRSVLRFDLFQRKSLASTDPYKVISYRLHLG